VKGNVYRREGARRDLIAIYRHHAREAGIRTADKFLASAESAFLRLAARPGIGTRLELENPLVGELRSLPLASRFKMYIVFYRPVAGGVEIARILHGARDIPSVLAEEFGPDGGEDGDAAGGEAG
jgi:toxin ParE1/3/4